MEAVENGRVPPTGVETGSGQPWDWDWEYRLRKYLMLLATLVVTVTYAAGFNPPGGGWQDTRDGQLAGDPIIRATHYHWFLAFYYCNATAFAASLVVIILILVLAISHDKKEEKEEEETEKEEEEKEEEKGNKKENKEKKVLGLLRFVMGLDLLSLMSAYGAGTYRDVVTAVLYCTVSVGTVLFYVVVLKCWFPSEKPKSASSRVKDKERLCKILMLLATFAVSVTYVAGLSTPGGYWDSTGGSHHPGDPILREHHDLRLTVFLFCNTTAFVASLFITMLLIVDSKLREKTERVWPRELSACIIVSLVGLVSAYIAGSCRETRATVSVMIILVAAFILLLVLSKWMSSKPKWMSSKPKWLSCCHPSSAQQNGENQQTDNVREVLDKARSLVVLLATLAATITYTAGLDPPGGLWQDNGDGHMAGDPILLTTNPGRYKAFYFCRFL